MSAAASAPTTMTSSPIVLITRASRAATRSTCVDEALDGEHAPPRRPAPRSGACSRRGRRRRSRRAARPGGGGSRRRRPPPCDRSTSCSTKCRRCRWCTRCMIGAASGSSSRTRSSISSAISHAGHAVAHQRLVDVEVEEPHLGVGDLRERLAVDAQRAAEGDAREPGLGGARDVGEQRRRRRARAAGLARRSAGKPTAVRRVGREPGLEADLLGGRGEGDLGPRGAEQVLDVAEGQRAPPLGVADLRTGCARAPAAARRAGPARRPRASTCRRSAGEAVADPATGASPA